MDVAADLLPRCERTFGAEHRRTMDVLAAHATALLQQGDVPAAIAEYVRAYTVQKRRLGPAHVDTFVAGQNLARAALKAGDPTLALQTTGALADQLAAADLPAVPAALTRLLHAQALTLAQRHDEAEPFAAAAHTALLALPQAHPLREQAATALAELLDRRGAHAEAEALRAREAAASGK